MHTDTTPTRRALLRAGGLAGLALLAGCTTVADRPGGGASPTPSPTASPTGTPDGGPPDDGTGNETGGTRPSGTGGPAVSLVGVDEPAAPLAADVTLTEPVATAEAPPALRVTLTNTGGTRVRVGEGRAARFQYVRDEDGRLVLLPAEGKWDAEPDCWRLRDDVLITEEYRTFVLDPGATATADLELYATPGDACLPVGEHSFRAPYQVGEADATSGEGDPGEWGFTVLLE
jgi:hypothetical protein